MKRMIALAPLAGWGLLSGGCQPADQWWLGVWTGERRGLTLPEKEDDIARQLRFVSITLKPGGRYEKMETSMPSTGRVQYGGKTAWLYEETLLGKPVSQDPNVARESKTMILEKQPDGTLLYWDPGALTPQGVSLKRKP
jgi:hypothetical protein